MIALIATALGAEVVATSTLAARIGPEVVLVPADADTQAMLAGEMHGGALPKTPMRLGGTCGLAVASSGTGWAVSDLGACGPGLGADASAAPGASDSPSPEPAEARADERDAAGAELQAKLAEYSRERIAVRSGSQHEPSGFTLAGEPTSNPLESTLTIREFWLVQRGGVTLTNRELRDVLGRPGRWMGVNEALLRARKVNEALRERLGLTISLTRAIDNAPLPPL